MRALRLRCRGLTNSFRQPDFHTYHKTLPLPPKTTMAGLIGAAMGIAPEQVNEEWLMSGRFQASVHGRSQGLLKDLWQYRKYTAKHIKAYGQGKEDFPWYRAVMMREMLYDSHFTIYFSCHEASDLQELKEAFSDPNWALSLGREDELIKITALETIDLQEKEGMATFRNTVLPFDIYSRGYSLVRQGLRSFDNLNLLSMAPSIVRLPSGFTYDGEVRQPISFQDHSFIADLAVQGEEERYFHDIEPDPDTKRPINLLFC